jgi:hypothetical protein
MYEGVACTVTRRIGPKDVVPVGGPEQCLWNETHLRYKGVALRRHGSGRKETTTGLQTERRMKNTSERPNDGRNAFPYKGMLSHEVKGEKEKTPKCNRLLNVIFKS